MVKEGSKDYERVINEMIDMREGPFTLDAVEISDVRHALRIREYKGGGLKGLAEAMRKAGWHLNEKNIIKVDGKVKKYPNFWSPRVLEMTPSERCRFYDEQNNDPARQGATKLSEIQNTLQESMSRVTG